VLAADRQASFLAWLGFRVVATYGRAEDFTAQELTRLARVAQDSGVGLIVDNLQSGPDAGRPLAEALKVKQVTLTNFPLHGDYIEALLANADTLAKLLK
jgi:zinc transport system substrate-binding protein